MNRVCVIGNSHLAALKLGWDVIKDEFPGANLTFFGSPKRNMADLRVENGALVAASKRVEEHLRSTSQGESEITASKFDVFIIVGLNFCVRELENIYRFYRAEEHKNTLRASQYVSNACFAQAAEGSLRNTLAFEVIGNLKKITDRRILIMPQPFPSEDITAMLYWKAMINHGDHLSLVRSYDRIVSELRAEGQHILEQPGETKSSEMFTKSEYSKGSVRLTKSYSIEHPDNDFWHMNQAYGIAVLRNILPTI